MSLDFVHELRIVCEHFSPSGCLCIFSLGYVLPKSPSGCWENSMNQRVCRSVHTLAVETAVSPVFISWHCFPSPWRYTQSNSCIQIRSHVINISHDTWGTGESVSTMHCLSVFALTSIRVPSDTFGVSGEIMRVLLFFAFTSIRAPSCCRPLVDAWLSTC